MPEEEDNIVMNEQLPAMMTMDLDLDGFGIFDRFFSSDLSPSFILLSPEQSLSPLWLFSDDNSNNKLKDGDDKLDGKATLSTSGAIHRLLSDTDGPDQATKKLFNNYIPMPILEVNPSEYQDAACIIKERITMALRYFTELGENRALAQFWTPVKNKDRYVLTTSGQPFVLGPNCTGLHQYRMASLMYMFSIDGETDGALELPGRVFKHKLPEWSPNVAFYSYKEYQRLIHALNCDVRGTLALPVFESSGQSCVGVLELVTTSEKINFAPDIDKVCKALEAVNLKSSDILDSPNIQICNESRQQAIAEILEVIAVVCETYNLPLAQTWVPCTHRSILAYGGEFKKSCSSFDGSCVGQVCMSPTDLAFYVVDAHMWGFREACVAHHLQKGQGVVGRAFATRSSCFCENIMHFGIVEYPLVHYARSFGLVGSFAICLRSTHTGDDDYILEFFLPSSMVDCKDQQTMLGSLLTSMNQQFRSFKVASGEEIGEDGRFVEVIKACLDSDVIDSGMQWIQLSESENFKNDASDVIYVESSTHTETSKFELFRGKRLSPIPKTLDKGKKPMVADNITRSERKYKTSAISLPKEDIEKQFGKTMKEAAKNLDVSLSTLKRKCNVLGISEWPGPNLVKRKANDSYIIQIDEKEERDNEMTRDMSNVNMNKDTLTIKAKYADDMLKFHLPISATFAGMESEIGVRFKLSVGTYKVKYLDEDGDWISLISDEEMSDCIKCSRKLDRIVVRLHVLPTTQPISIPSGSST